MVEFATTLSLLVYDAVMAQADRLENHLAGVSDQAGDLRIRRADGPRAVGETLKAVRDADPAQEYGPVR